MPIPFCMKQNSARSSAPRKTLTKLEFGTSINCNRDHPLALRGERSRQVSKKRSLKLSKVAVALSFRAEARMAKAAEQGFTSLCQFHFAVLLERTLLRR